MPFTRSSNVRLALLISIILSIGLIPLYLQIFGIVEGRFTSDFVHQIIPFFYEAKRMFSSGAPWWSWNSFLGDNYIAANSYYTVGSPFTWLCCLLPESWLLRGILFTIYMQYICMGLAAKFYLSRMINDKQLVHLGAILYTFSSFTIVNECYYIFTTAFILLPLLLAFIEDIYRQNKWGFIGLTATAFVLTVANYYFAALSFLSIGIYVLFRVLCTTLQHKFKNILLPISAIILGILMSSFIFIPTLLGASGSVKAESHLEIGNVFSWIITAFDRLSCLYFPAFNEGFALMQGGVPFASSQLYIAVLGFFLVVAFILHNKTSWLTWLIICLLLIYLTPLNLLFSFGTNQFYSRWGYFIILMCILASLYSLEKCNYSLKLYWCFIASALVPLTFILKSAICHSSFTSNQYIVYISEFVLFLIGSTLLGVWVYRRYSIQWLVRAVIVVATLNTFGFYYCTAYLKTDNNLNLMLRNDFPAKQDNIFEYRTYFTNISGNFANIKHVPSICYYHSIVNPLMNDYIETLHTSNSISHLYPESSSALLSVRDIVEFKNVSFNFSGCYSRINEGLSFIKAGESYTLYANSNYIPMGFAYDSYLPEKKIKQICADNLNIDISKLLLCVLSIKKEDEPYLSQYLKVATPADTAISLVQAANNRRLYHAKSFRGDTKGFSAVFDNPERSRVYFFSVPADRGFSATLDGKPITIYKVNLNMMGFVIPPGLHYLRAEYTTPGLKTGILFTLIGFICFICILIYTKVNVKN